MTDLQLGLALIGALAVAGVLVYNRLQERRVRRSAERAFASGHSDVLLDEPHGRREPTFEAPPRPPQRQGEAMPDPRVDYVIELAVPGGVEAARLLGLWAPLAQRFPRRVLLAGFDGREWRCLAAVQDVAGDEPSCTELRAALQLVSRAGVVGDPQLLEFRAAVESLAASLGAAVAAPEMRQALDAARQLDQTCEQADVQVALHVVGIAPPHDLVEGQHPFVVAPRDDGVTLTLDVGRTPDPARSYQAMAHAGLQLAAAGGGRLVDDNGAALDERALAAVGAQLDAVRLMLAGRGIEPGSPLALRLFS